MASRTLGSQVSVMQQGYTSKMRALPLSGFIRQHIVLAAGDWLQGPYVYALYQHYGFDRGDIGRLFIAGFGSSAIFGTIVGSLADKT